MLAYCSSLAIYIYIKIHYFRVDCKREVESTQDFWFMEYRAFSHCVSLLKKPEGLYKQQLYISYLTDSFSHPKIFHRKWKNTLRTYRVASTEPQTKKYLLAPYKYNSLCIVRTKFLSDSLMQSSDTQRFWIKSIRSSCIRIACKDFKAD